MQEMTTRTGELNEPVDDATFESMDGEVTLRQLFGRQRDLLFIHNMGKRCAYCTMWADGLNGLLPHLQDRAAVVLASPDDPKTQHAFAESRGWKFRMVSTRKTSFNRDLGYESDDGHVWPGVSALYLKDDGEIVRTGKDHFGPGDVYCAAWHLFGLLREGTNGWQPKS